MPPSAEPKPSSTGQTLVWRLLPVLAATDVAIAVAAILLLRAGVGTLEEVATVGAGLIILVQSAAVISTGRRLRSEELGRERLAEDLRLSHERFVLAVEGSSDGLWDWNVLTNQVYFSPRYKSMLGYEDSEVENGFAGWERLIHPDDLPLARKKVGDYHDGLTPVYELEHRLLHKDGSYRWILARGSILRDSAGKVVRMSGSHTDIDTRKHMEESLRESAERFRQVTENISEVIWLSDTAKNKIIYISPGYELVWGRTCQSLYDQPRTWLEALHPEDRDRVLEAATTKQIRGDYDETYRIVRPNGEIRWVRDRAFPVRGDDGSIYRIAGLTEDITERRRMEEALRAARDAALASDKAKSEFLSNVSHEIRTPLNAIQGMCELMAVQHLPEPHGTRAKLAHDAVKILTTTIDDLLDTAKLEAEHMALDSIPTDVRAIIAESLSLMRASASAKGLELTLDMPVPPPPFLLVDPTRLRQIIINFLSNAIKFTERGAVSLAVSIEPRGEKEVALRVAVRDQGIGIAPEVQSRLFQPFIQADPSTTRHYGGSGLGLAICRRLVELMGGEIGLESAPGAGSTFWFRVPLPVVVACPRAAALPSAAVGLDRLRVLVVEDNAANRRITLEILEHLGVKAEAVENGAQCLERLARSGFDLVFMDCSMPVMDGYEATAAWRRQEPPGARLPIIAMTAYALKGDQEKCLAAGMDGYLSKPVRLQDFVAALSHWGAPIDPAVHERAAALIGLSSPRWKIEYLEDARRLLGEMRSASGANLARAAHTLRGASIALGARRLSALCARIEDAGAATPAQLDEAEREFALVASALS